MEDVISVGQLYKSYNGLPAVENVSISVKRGTVFGLLGANGAGKSTTIECILGTKKPDMGTVSILGMNPLTARKKLFERVGVQFQEANYQEKITVEELCSVTESLYKVTTNYQSLLKQFGISDKSKSFVSELSGGQKQRLFIVLALIPNPEVVFLDELTTGLDPKARRDVWKSLSNLKARGLTIFLTSHYMDEIEALCDTICILKKEKLCFMELLMKQLLQANAISLRTLIFGLRRRRVMIMKTFRTMLKTELRLSLRGMDMFIFAICMPLVVLIILGIIYGNKPAFEGAEYTFLQQSFGALATISICAGGVMGLPLVVSDYRSKKILKRFKVTPVTPAMILIVQVVIYAIYALASLALVYMTATIFFNYQLAGSWLHFLMGYFLVMISMFSMGMMVGGIVPNTKMVGVVASLLYFPMLIFSGATLPYEIMPAALQRIADILPLTQGIKILKAASLGLPTEGVFLSFILMVALSVICIGVSIKFFKWE